jgi:ribosome modulation factor
MTKKVVKQVRQIHQIILGDPYKMGYQAGVSGRGHTTNPYPRAILAPRSTVDGVSCYHRWFCGWNDGLDKAEKI